MSGKPEALRWQFDDIAQQKAADVMGMWVFLVTEVLFFGGLFLAYALARYLHAGAFEAGSRELNLVLGTVNTGVLLTSSLTMALADHAVKRRRRQLSQWMLAFTMALGLAFLVIKGIEYRQEFLEHRIPFLNAAFEWPGTNPAHGKLFFNLYFAMTGLHALHLIIGCGLLGTLLLLNRDGAAPNRVEMRIETSGLYWHFVDIVWVFLFPLFYLVR